MQTTFPEITKTRPTANSITQNKGLIFTNTHASKHGLGFNDFLLFYLICSKYDFYPSSTIVLLFFQKKKRDCSYEEI